MLIDFLRLQFLFFTPFYGIVNNRKDPACAAIVHIVFCCRDNTT